MFTLFVVMVLLVMVESLTVVEMVLIVVVVALWMKEVFKICFLCEFII